MATKLEALLDYIASSGGCARHEFWDGPAPDLDAARRFAQQMRRQLADVSDVVEVGQRYNVVRLTVCQAVCV